jgi:hypothetical protein
VVAAKRSVRGFFVVALFLAVASTARAVVVPDAGFGAGGGVQVAGFDDNGSDDVHLAVAADGALVFALAGRSSASGGNVLVLGKLQADGAIDAGFGGGVAQTPVGSPAQTVDLARLLPLSDGGVLAFVWLRRAAGIGDALLLRFGADGKPSRDFNHGLALSLPLPQTADAWTAHKHGDGFLIASIPWRPFLSLPPMTHGSARLLRVTGDGRLDTAFGRAGLVELPDLPGRYGDTMPLSDGGFQVLHTAARDGRAVNRWRRYRADGTVDGGDGWRDVGDDGDRHLVDVFALASGRYAVVSDASMLSGYLDRDGRMTTAIDGPDSTRTVQPFDRGRALVGIYRESGLIPTPGQGTFLTALDAAGTPDGTFREPRPTGTFGLPARLTRHNFVADSPWTFAVADYHAATGIRFLRYVELRGDGGARPVPAAGTLALLSIALVVLLAGLRQLRHDARRSVAHER